jgi:PAS domain S-box-containing protein
MNGMYRHIKTIYESEKTKIYRAVDISENNENEVVIKVLNKRKPNAVDIGKIRNEYMIVNKIDHPNVIRNYDMITFNGSPAIVMEDIGGESLLRIWEKSKRSLIEKIQIACQIATALEGIHKKNIIHKDINPANIIWSPMLDIIKIIDFGISNVRSEHYYKNVNTNKLEGTFAFMAPEQTGKMNRIVDHRSDLYSYGCTLYWLFTGNYPFVEKDPSKLLYAHIAKYPKSPASLNKKIPDVISDIIMKLMAKDTDNRYLGIVGVKHDLECCKNQFKKEKKISNFKIAQNDILKKFQIPKVLYGRASEKKIILSKFENACKGNVPELLLVTGESGSGKTLLVKELQRSIAERNGLYLSGKFDEMESSIPHGGIIQVLEELFEYLLQESQKRLDAWKEKINSAIRPNGRILIDVVPNAKIIIGSQPKLIDVPAHETENRFIQTIKNIVEIFAKKESPLIIFFDDLQWSDSVTLQIIEEIMFSKINYLLLICAYRDKEVSKNHPLSLMLDKLQQHKINVKKIVLNPLKKDDVKFFVEDTLKCGNPQMSSELGELLYITTKGNPFHMVQLMPELQRAGIFTYCKTEKGWSWDKEKLNELDIMSNVVKFMINKLRLLTRGAQKTIISAACINNVFDMEIIRIACGIGARRAYKDISEAINLGFIVPSENYKYMDEKNSGVDIKLRFYHDRIREAAYELLDEEEKKILHHEIGQKFLEEYYKNNANISVFDVVKQLNHSPEKIIENTKKNEIAKLNLNAGRKASSTAAWKQAFEYYETAINMLSVDDWDKNYELMISLYTDAVRAACIKSDFVKMERLACVALENAKTILDKCKIWETQLKALIAQAKLQEANDLGIQSLHYLGINIRENIPKMFMMLSLFKTIISLKKIKRVLSTRIITDPKIIAAARILTEMLPGAYMSGKKTFFSIVLNSINIIKKYGYYPDTAWGLVCYSGLLRTVNIKHTSAQYAEVALKLADRPDAKLFRAKIIYAVTAFSLIWSEPYKCLIQRVMEGYKSGAETGDVEYAAFNIYCHFYLRFISGEHLDSIKVAMIENEHKTHRHQTVWGFYCLYLQLIDNLRDQSANPINLTGNYCDEDSVIKEYGKGFNNVGYFDFYTKKLMLTFLFYQTDLAVKAAREIDKYYEAAILKHDMPVAILYKALLLVDLIRKDHKKRNANHKKQLKRYKQKMKTWADQQRENYGHKYYLIEAEFKSLEGRTKRADEYYNKAVELAEENGIVQELALSIERFAIHCKINNNIDDYNKKIVQAFDIYKSWGAIAKCKAMIKQYKKIFKDKEEPLFYPFLEEERLQSKESNDSEMSAIDLQAVIRASRVISKKMDISSLSESLLSIVVENSGAQKGLFLIQSERDINVQSNYKNRIEGDEGYPKSVINYSVSTRNAVAIDDITKSNYINDKYFRENHTKSLLCIPLVRNNKTVAVIYLENSLTTNTFTKERVKVAEAIASHATILFENSLLYSAVAQSEARYRNIVENVMDGIFQVSPDGMLLTANNSLKEMFQLYGEGRGDRETRVTLSKYLNDESQLSNAMEKLGKDGFIKNYEADIRVGGKKIIRCMINAQTIRGEGGEIKCYEGSIKDITKQKQIQELTLQKKAAEAKALAKSNFMASMSHDIRTPINTILGFSELLKENLPNDPILNEYIGNIDSSGKMLLALINEILEFSKIESGKVKLNYRPVTILAVIEDIVMQFDEKVREKGLGFNINTDLFFKDLTVKIDELRLKQIMINIIDNAYKYTDEGHVSIFVKKNSEDDKRLNMSIIVEDTGPGITEQEKIFDEYEQIQVFDNKLIDGAGLGLSIVKKLVALMGAKVDICSEKGKGTKFGVNFPNVEIVECPGRAKEKINKIKKDIRFEGQNIVVADDNRKNRNLIKEYTKNYDLNIIEAKNGRQAVRLVEEGGISLVLMDIKMPIMNGIKATKKIKKGEMKDIPIIAITADTREETKIEVVECGFDLILLKPISKDTLTKELIKYLSHSLSADEFEIDTKAKVFIDYEESKKGEILEEMNMLMFNELEKITKTMIISDITKFAEKIKNIGTKYKSNYLEEWGKNLERNAVNFRNRKIQEMLNQYPDLILTINDA